MLKSQEYSNCHEPLSQEWINGRLSKLAVAYVVTGLESCRLDWKDLQYPQPDAI